MPSRRNRYFHRTRLDINNSCKWDLRKNNIPLVAILTRVQTCTVSFALTPACRLRQFIPRLMFNGNLITISLVKNDMKQYELIELKKGQIMKQPQSPKMKRDGARRPLSAIILQRVGTAQTALFLSLICELQSSENQFRQLESR